MYFFMHYNTPPPPPPTARKAYSMFLSFFIPACWREYEDFGSVRCGRRAAFRADRRYIDARGNCWREYEDFGFVRRGRRTAFRADRRKRKLLEKVQGFRICQTWKENSIPSRSTIHRRKRKLLERVQGFRICQTWKESSIPSRSTIHRRKRKLLERVRGFRICQTWKENSIPSRSTRHQRKSLRKSKSSQRSQRRTMAAAMVATVATSQRRILLQLMTFLSSSHTRGASQQGSCKLVDSRGYTYGVEDCFQEVTYSHVVMMLPFAPNHTDVSRRLVKMLLMEEERINKRILPKISIALVKQHVVMMLPFVPSHNDVYLDVL